MRRLVLALPLLLSACLAPRTATEPEVAQPVPVTRPATGQLIGLTTSELVGHFGSPALQVHEGSSLKLQFRGKLCVLDAYLYPAQNSTLRVTYVDTRTKTGVDTDQAACISALENPS
jgi:nitrous oxide reductase accessory protein NosL